MKNYTNEKNERIMQLINMTDADFYDKYISKMSLEDQVKFLEEFPEFLREEELSKNKGILYKLHLEL